MKMLLFINKLVCKLILRDNLCLINGKMTYDRCMRKECATCGPPFFIGPNVLESSIVFIVH